MIRCASTHASGRRCQLETAHSPVRHCAQIGDTVTAWAVDRADVMLSMGRVFGPDLAGKLPWCEDFPTDETALFDLDGPVIA